VIQAPSNLALVKYWGKDDPSLNFPANDSLSFVFADFWTQCEAKTNLDRSDDLWEVYTFGPHGCKEPLEVPQGFLKKGKMHLERLRELTQFDAPLSIAIGNNFAHGCGIASSASSMAALTVASIAAWTGSTSFADLANKGWDTDKLASLARLGSGSACRSFLPGFSWWQRGSSPNEQKVESVCAPSDMLGMVDTLVLVNTAPKKIPSSTGHLSAGTSPLFAPRKAVIPERIAKVISSIEKSDFDTLGSICELEALDLHAIAMSADEPAYYLQPKTSEVLSWLRTERSGGTLPAYFTLDAGANVHILSRKEDAANVKQKVSQRFPGLGVMQSGIGTGVQFICSDHLQMPKPNLAAEKHTSAERRLS
jgi:diphosphomevalonate decarboxylase